MGYHKYHHHWQIHCQSMAMATIVNLSITTGTFPSTLKSSIISPLLKKPTLNKEDLSNYCPIANLSISKLTKKIVKKRLLDHLISNSLLNPFQSAYTKFYSTETTLLSLHDHFSDAISATTLLPLSSWSICCLWYSRPLHPTPSSWERIWKNCAHCDKFL